MRFYFYTIFLSAFLLFQVQPMIARFILPVFGGSSAVWSTCILFFQAGLLIGYGYAHIITRILSNKNQVKVHLAFLAISLIAIPIIPKEWMKPGSNENPVEGILSLLTFSVGLPYIILSTTGPLLQYWFSLTNTKKSPYRLYALSNLGSVIGLLSYPLLVEPFLDLNVQAWYWSAGYIFFIILCGLTAKNIWNVIAVNVKPTEKKTITPDTTTKIIWFLLATMGTVTLLSITNKITQDIVVIPFLWIIPLLLYLISFIIAFDNPKWYKRWIFLSAMFFMIALILRRQIQAVVYANEMPVNSTIFIYCLGAFLLCMVLHGELARLKPGEKSLTFYYLIISAGGVMGGIFISLIVPFIFKGYWEIYCAFAGSICVILLAILKNKVELKSGIQRPAIYIISFASIIGIFYSFKKEYKAFNDGVIVSTRNFYGVLKILEADKGTNNWQRLLIHGDVTHGIQFLNPAYENYPVSYYAPESGIGLALSKFTTRADSNYKGMKVGMIGLGIGTISAYATDKDLYRYYEINPEVEILARKYFKFLGNSKSKVEIINGDGRISLENEFKLNGSNQYDVLAVDAFSGDVIPTHLLTREAGDLYLKHLKKDGILAFHVTNQYLNLLPVMNGLSETLKMPLYHFYQAGSDSGPSEAVWIIFTHNNAFLIDPLVRKNISSKDKIGNQKIIWTDNYSSILPLFKK